MNKWTIARNDALTDNHATIYTLYFCGLVRGQLVGLQAAQLICEALNAADVEVAYTAS